MDIKQLENIFAAAGAPAEAAQLLLAELADGGVELSGCSAAGLAKAARELRLAGRLPYYTAAALGCIYAAREIEGDLKAAVAAELDIARQPELLEDIALFCAAAREKAPLLRGPKQVEYIKRGYERGYQAEKQYRGCAQCTLEALFAVVESGSPELFRSADMLASGCGLFCDGPCGGYSGGLLYMGRYAGRHLEKMEAGDREEQLRGRRLAGLLHQRFLSTYGTIVCGGIHNGIFGRGFDLYDADDKLAFEAAGAHKEDKCTAVVANSTRWVMEILLDEGCIAI